MGLLRMNLPVLDNFKINNKYKDTVIYNFFINLLIKEIIQFIILI